MSVERKFKAFFLTSAFLLIMSLIVWLVPSVFIGSITGRIELLQFRGGLSQAEQQTVIDLQWSKIWWETTQATIFNPIAIVLFVVALLILVYGAITKFGW